MAIVVLAGSCKKQPTPAERPTTLTVFAAASLTEAFGDIARRFEAANPGVRIVCNFAGSQQLCEQLNNGAAADLFASASTKQIDAVKSLIDLPTVRIFARNTLVIIYPAGNPADVHAFADLARPGVKLDVADPAVPVGALTLRMLDAVARASESGHDFKARVLANIVSREDNVKSVVTKVRLGEADAGVVYASDIAMDNIKDVGVILVPNEFNQTTDYPIAVTLHAAQPALARRFEEFVFSSESQQVLKAHGFVSSPPGASTRK